MVHFEYLALDNGNERQRYQKAHDKFSELYDAGKKLFTKQDRLLVVEAWLAFESEHQGDVATVEAKMPKMVKKRRRMEGDAGWEEYHDYVFPDDEGDKPNIKLLAMAHEWKMKMAQLPDSDESEEEED